MSYSLGFQLKDLSASMKAILYNEETKGEELLVSVMNLLISAARFQVYSKNWQNFL